MRQANRVETGKQRGGGGRERERETKYLQFIKTKPVPSEEFRLLAADRAEEALQVCLARDDAGLHEALPGLLSGSDVVWRMVVAAAAEAAVVPFF